MRSLHGSLAKFGLVLGTSIIAASASANDTTAVLGAGGLELTSSADIVMEKEELFLSPQEVRVRYVFRNESDQDITTQVAFPLPDVDLRESAEMVNLPDGDDENFVDFSVVADGQPVEPKLEQSAIGDDGTDITAAVKEAGLPVDANLPSWDEKIQALPSDVRQRLAERNILTVESEDDGDGPRDVAYPNWSLQSTYHWEQTFPAHEPLVVEHSYQPIVGSSFIYEEGDLAADNYKQAYCLDSHGEAGVRRLLGRLAAANPDDGGAFLLADEVQYILTTGANWKGPIGRFELTIDKIKPHAILSLCIDGIRKTGATTFKVERTNFTPTEDFGFVVFHLEERDE